MTERAITGRVAILGEQLNIDKLSAHDCRHYWATHAVQQGTDAFALKDAGGWNSIAMPSRYVEAATVANDRVKLLAGVRSQGAMYSDRYPCNPQPAPCNFEFSDNPRYSHTTCNEAYNCEQ